LNLSHFKKTKKMNQFKNLKTAFLFVLPIILLTSSCKVKQEAPIPVENHEYANRVETIKPILVQDLANCAPLNFQSTTRTTSDFTAFDGIPDNDGQADLQVAVGGGYVVHATNSGISVFDKSGQLLTATTQSCLNDGIDPKLFFDVHNQVFAIDYWHYYDQPKLKPLNISVSATSDHLVIAKNGWATPTQKTKEVVRWRS
jgi:hypothetical protein